MYLTLILAFCAFLCAWALTQAYSWRARKLFAGLPGFPQLPIIGNVLKLKGGSEVLYQLLLDISKKMEEHQKPLAFWFGPIPVIIVSDPEDVKTVTNTFIGKPYIYLLGRIWLGDGLLTASSSIIWKRNIKKVGGTFTGSVVDGYQQVFNAQALKLVERLTEEVGGAPFDIMHKYLGYTSLESIFGTRIIMACLHFTSTETALGVSHLSENMLTTEYFNAFTRTLELLIQRGVNLLLHPDWVYHLTPMYKELVKHVAVMHNVSNTVIANRRKELNEMKQNGYYQEQTPENGRSKFRSFLDTLLELSEADPSIQEEWIRAEVDTIIVAGQETVATTLMYIILMIGSKPGIQDQLYAEIKSIFGDSRRSIQKEDLARMTYCEAVIYETLRLYPPLPFVVREADQDCKLRYCTIPKGVFCAVNVLGAGRSQHTWGPDALEFKPERWLESGLPNSASFLAFSYGKRACIGRRYAMAFLKTMLACCLRDLEFIAQTDNLKFKIDIVLKPVSGHFVKVRLRQ